jgi:amino acid transporter
MAKAQVFAREATGLVRAIGLRDHAITNLNGVGLLITIPMAPIWIFTVVSGGDAVIGAAVGGLLTLLGPILAYAMASATFPRSAAPYVTESRVLAPWIGWPGEFNMFFTVIFWIPGLVSGTLLYTALIPGLYATGISSGNPGLISAANWLMADIRPTLIIGEVFLILVTLIAVSGTRRLVTYFQLPVTIISFIAAALIIGLLATTTHAQFVALVPKYLGNTYDGILAAGMSQLPSMMVGTSFLLYPVLVSAAFSQGNSNSYWNSYGCGEVKRARDIKMQLISMIVPSVAMTLILIAVYSMFYGFAGREFLIALVNFSTIGGSVIKAPLSWGGVGLMYVMMMIADNFWLQLFIIIGIVCSALSIVAPAWMVVSRELFAWSFDRVIPTKFSEVSERWHTPTWSIITGFILMNALFFITTFLIQYLGAFMTMQFDTAIIAETLLCISAALLPLRKSLWAQSPVKDWKLFGIPAISIAGVIGAVYLAWCFYVFTFTPGTGFGLISQWMLVAFIGAPFILYWIIRAIRKRQDIDLDMVFRMIPPE